MKRLFLLAVPLLLAACGDDLPAKHPVVPGKLAGPLTVAFKEEAIGDPAKAIELWSRALSNAATSPDDPAAIPVETAALDALVHRSVAAFSDAGLTSALADRVPASALGKNTVDARLAGVQKEAEGPFAAGLVAEARLALAERRGDAAAATTLRAQTGCVQNATLVGPVAWLPTTGVEGATGVDAPGAAAPSEVVGPGPFITRLPATPVNALGCHLPLYAQQNVHGVRDVIVDVDVPKAGTIGIGFRSNSPAVIHAAGQVAFERPASAGQGRVARYGRVEADRAGTLRIVARVGMDNDFETIELLVWDANGKPLKTHAPAPGAKATVGVKSALAQVAPPAKTDPERVANALGALAMRETREAENLLHPQIARTDAPPDLLLTYARAVRLARDLPAVKSSERARSAYERVLEAWPTSWEAITEHAVLAAVRVGRAESNIEALNDLEKTRAKTKSATSPMLDAFDAETAGREHLYDRARASLDRARGALGGTTLLHGIERMTIERTGADLIAFDCDPQAAIDRTNLACFTAKRATGDRAGAEAELGRLRALAGSPQLYLSYSTQSALETGDLQQAAALSERMNPGDRQLATLFATKGAAATPDFIKLATIARDSPSALPGLYRAAGDDPLKTFDGIAERVTSDEKAGPLLANAATAVLAHDERYDVEANGLTHFTMLDVRRVMGTADVESNAEANAPLLYGRDTVHILRRRIFKRDGRILLPDATPRAAQSHADLQLETGDAVEAIYEGYGIPGDMGNIGIDTPDLLPERTAVRDARVEIRLPESLKVSMWAHPMLGKPTEKTENGKHVFVWAMKDRTVRRVEYGVPKMDRNVGVSFSTTTWDDVGRGLRETIAALDVGSPEVSAWAQDLDKCDTGRCGPSRVLVDKVVAASGEAVKEANGIVLADLDLGRGGGQVTARTVLATHEGSRTLLIVRALRELGVHTDIVVAENDPFSDSPTFPPHFGRFMHPLAVAHVPSAKDPNVMEDIWVDADVPGPPLPAGRISPELRGRQSLRADGRITALPNLGGDNERDEIDERLVVDEDGNAKGSLTVLLRGRSAQDLAEALTRIVGNDRQRALRGIALAWVPFATVEKVELSSSEGSWQIAIRADLTAPAYAQVEGNKPGSRSWVLPGIDPIHYVYPRPYTTSLSATYASQGARESALAISHATQYHMRRRVELPAKASIARLPGPFEGKGPLISAARKISVAGNAVEEDFTLDVSTGTVPRDKYDAFVSEIHHADDGFRSSIRVKPPVP